MRGSRKWRFWTGTTELRTCNKTAAGDPIASALLGSFDSFSQSTARPTGYFRYNQAEFYVQDTWKVSPKWTLNYGVRWEPFLPGYEANNQTAHFDRAAFDSGVHSKVYVNAPAGLQLTVGRRQDSCPQPIPDLASGA